MGRDAASWRFKQDDEIVPGRYAKRLLGGGTRYEAYLAWDDELYSLVVAKLLRPSHVDKDYAREGLAAEAEMLQRLSHPSLLRSFDAVVDGERPHLILEFLEGPRLSTLLRKHGPLSIEQLVPLGVQVCSAIHYMARRGVVHLDVKPKNIIMGAPPRLIDLSVARDAAAAARLTTQIGTDAYMAPEQCEPERGGIGPASDVWGIGVTLFEAACGYRPFPSPEEDGDPYPQLRFEPLPLPDGLPHPLVEVIEACLQPEPAARPTAAEVAQGLEPVLAALPTRPRLGRFKPR
ncbi:MAG TPA: serine/threonine-protein kinase [Actinomycetota bacterium]|jgi:eukaryotic-like serine/threonine-protein kinase|nr:serine/threonine-protein kinase [Actinomycetota bacterium]